VEQLDILIFLLAIDATVFFLCLFILSFRDKVMTIRDYPKSVGGPIPPKHMLNNYGKIIYAVLWVSACFFPVGVIALLLVEYV